MYSRKLGDRTLSFGHEGILYKNSFILYDKQTDSLWVHTTGEAIKGKLKGKQLEFLPSEVTTWKSWRGRYPDTTVLTGRKARGMMGTFDLARNMKRYGLSVGQGKKAKLYPFEILKEKTVLNDEFDGKKLVVVFDAESATSRVYERGDQKIEKLEDVKPLKRLPATPWLIDRWRAFYPKGEVYRSGE